MESTLYSIANIRTMEVIDINSGTKLGYIKDFKIDVETYRITDILMPSQKIALFGKNNDIEIPWENVKKIGVDVILIDGTDYILNNKE